MTDTDRAYAAVIADWCARSLAEAKESGAFDTRCFVQNVDLIIAALREYAGERGTPERSWVSIAGGISSLPMPNWGYPNHPGIAGPCKFRDSSEWNGHQWTKSPGPEATRDTAA